MRLLIVIFLSVLFVPVTQAASWYINPSNVSGTTNGTSWATGWVNPNDVVWPSTAAGDTLYVSGGATSQLYTNSLYIYRDGTSSNYFRVRVGQDAGHSGVAIFTNCMILHDNSRPKWRWIDGSRSDAFAAPTNHQQVVSGATAITNNIGFRFVGVTGTNNLDTSPNIWFYRNPDGMRHSWLEISGMTNVGTFNFSSNRGSVCKIDLSDEAGNPTTNNVFEYLYLFNNAGEQFLKVSGTPVDYDDYVWKFCNLHKNGEDHFEVSGGITIRDSVIGPVSGTSAHVDLFQFTGDKFKIYNNDIRESINSVMRVQTAGEGDFTSDFFFFNNLVTEKVGRAKDGGTINEYITFCHWDPQVQNSVNIGGYSNLVVANNLIYNSITNLGQNSLSLGGVTGWPPGANYTNKLIYGLKFVNNLVIDKQKGASMPSTTNAGGKFWSYTTNDVWVDYNTHAATNANLTDARVLNAFDEDILDGSSAYSFSNNTNYPAFTDKAGDNFELLGSDTVALNRGYDMSTYFNFDALNRPRNALGAWDRGPLELQQDPDLLAAITFEDVFTDSALDDSSGNGNHGHRFGRPGSVAPTNFPLRISASATGGTNASSYAGDFYWNTNSDYGFYLRDGNYAAITNVPAFTNRSQMTIAVRARYNSARRIGSTYDYSQDGNATLLSAGTASADIGSWDLQRFNSEIWINNTRFLVVTNSNFGVAQVGNGGDLVFGKAGKAVFNFPDRGYDNNGDTTNWHHYAMTFNAGVVTTYFDGVPLVTNDLSGTTTTLTVGMNVSVNSASGFIGIGCNTHGGTPALEAESGEDYPNHGWFNGQMDDVIMYSRALAWAEVVVLSGYPVDAGSSEGGGGGPVLQPNTSSALPLRFLRP